MDSAHRPETDYSSEEYSTNEDEDGVVKKVIVSDGDVDKKVLVSDGDVDKKVLVSDGDVDKKVIVSDDHSHVRKTSSPGNINRGRGRGRGRRGRSSRGRMNHDRQYTQDITKKSELPKKNVRSLTGEDVRNPEERPYAPLIKKEELVMGEILGKGAFGKVYKGLLRGTVVAVKELKNKELNVTQFQSEVNIMIQLRHPNVILFMGASIEPPMIVAEYLDGGDLHTIIEGYEKLLKDGEAIPITEMLKLAIGIAKGMAWLHQSIPPIIHKDLKPKNIMLDSNGVAKIIDFGLSEVQKSKEIQNKKVVGSACWMAPEMLKGEPFSEKIDVYAFGIILWQLFTGSPTVYDTSKYDGMAALDAFQSFVSDVADSHVRPEIPNNLQVDYSLTIVKVIESSWDPNPLHRPSFEQIIRWLHQTMLYHVLKDADAITMWKQYFPDKMKVKVGDFYGALWKTIGKEFPPTSEADIIKQKCLKAVIFPGGVKQPSIDIERFGQLLHWYGPLCPTHSKGNMLDKIEALLRYPWFHGEISSREAEEILNRASSKAKNDFLIRCSMSSDPFTISRIESNKKYLHIAHHRISYSDTTGEYKMNFESKDILKEIKGETLGDFLKSAKNVLKLKEGVKNKKYEGIFGPTKVTQSPGEYKVWKK